MHGMTNSESAKMISDSRKGKLFYYNGNKLCIATYNCVIFSVECITSSPL